VDLSDDLPPQRRPLFFPVVIATVFLSIIGMSVGLVLGSRHRQDVGETQQHQPRQQATTPVVPEATEDDRPPCRKETRDVARRFNATGTLRIALLLRTGTSAVWICEDEAGRLYYHANRGGEKARWIENETALFLPDVQRDGDGYVVTAPDGTNFSVTRERLFIVHKDGRQEIQEAAG
jgi:hypothetical protein